ncbi:hypothetical protein K6119_04315 [Paracrocinitomix mangrovi]|uniref:hypothetical protein n=1 Tax=Paracrocinitomix mangrovi TaxID=2862509 RepID=UPI001C8DE12F|nr:hypothetical protein [Paracrocinitomix mangrovi]UKN02738.1 hypothetical protein K6119_04315 [Paracrocinitomix mangrovi]
MKFLTQILIVMVAFNSYGQQLNIGLHISNPIRDTKVGWYDIDAESFDDHDLKNRSIAYELTSTYALKKFDLRLRMNYMRINILEYQDNYFAGTRNQVDVQATQNKFSISPGIFKRINIEQLSLSFGFEAIYTYHGQFKMNLESLQSDSISGTVFFDSFGTSTIPSGYAIGLGTPFNFGFKIGNRFVIQAEYSPSMYYAKLGGTTVSTEYSNNPFYSDSGSWYTEDVYEGFAHLEHRFSFGLVYWMKL